MYGFSISMSFLSYYKYVSFDIGKTFCTFHDTIILYDAVWIPLKYHCTTDHERKRNLFNQPWGSFTFWVVAGSFPSWILRIGASSERPYLRSSHWRHYISPCAWCHISFTKRIYSGCCVDSSSSVLPALISLLSVLLRDVTTLWNKGKSVLAVPNFIPPSNGPL